MSPSTLYAGVYAGGVFKSIDGGATWNDLSEGLTTTRIQALVIDPDDPRTLYAGTPIGAFSIHQGALPCSGDCNGDARVAIDELLTMVNILLGDGEVATCSAGDDSHNGQIEIAEILTAVNDALLGCPR